MKLYWIMGLICFVFFLNPAQAMEVEGPIDFSIEPILSSKWSCYIQEGDLYVKRFDEEPLKIRASKETKVTILSPDIKANADTLFISWIERGSEGKKVYYASINKKDSQSSKPIELVSKTKAVQVKILISASGKPYILEIFPGKEPEVFIIFSLENVMNLKRVRLDTKGLEVLFYLSPIMINNTIYLFFYGLEKDGKYLGMKAYEFPSLNVKESAQIKDTDSISFIEAFRVKERPAVIYKTKRDNRFMLDFAVKSDKGWVVYTISQVEGLDVARVDHYVWDDGRMLIVFSGEKRGEFKQRVYTAISKNLGKSWWVQRIDTKEFDNTRSWLPRMVVNGDKVAIAWEDSRNIRAGIRMQLSSDKGERWLGRDIPLSDNKFYAFRPRISSDHENIYLAWHQYRTDEKRYADIVMIKLTWQEAFKMVDEKREEVIPPEEKKKLLLDSVKRYWKGMIEKDFKTTYRLHDPFYRARISLDFYTSHMGPMVYHEYEITDVKIEGNEAYVKLKIRYEIPSFRIMGREVSMPLKDFPIEDTWLFIDGKWYRKFVDALSGGSAIKY